MFFNRRNGQGHFVRYFDHRFLVNASKDEYSAALGRERLDDAFDLTERFAGMKLRLDIVLAAEQFEVGDRLETDDLVPTGCVDHEVAGDGEKIGATGRHILPVFRGISTGQDFGDHILQFMRARKDATKAPAQGGFLWQNDGFEPFQFSANPLHDDPLLLPTAPLPNSIMTF